LADGSIRRVEAPVRYSLKRSSNTLSLVVPTGASPAP
jgi:hypothetical protein